MKSAFLSGSLISAKGHASPTSRPMPPEELVKESKRSDLGNLQKNADRTISQTGSVRKQVSSEPVRLPVKPTRALEVTPNIEPVAAQALKEFSDNLRQDKLGRVRMSVRMSPEQHLNLKLVAAHSKLSAQTIIEQALDEYVTRHGADLIPDACACIRDKILS